MTMTYLVAQTRRLTAADLKEIDTAVQGVLARGSKLEDVTADDFPLPHLGPVLQVCTALTIHLHSWM